METKDFIDCLEKCFDDTASPDEQDAVIAGARSSAEHAELLRQMVEMDCHLAIQGFSESKFVAGVMSEITRSGNANAMARAARIRIEREMRLNQVADSAIGGRLWRPLLAAAACLAIVAGGWWFYQGRTAGLGLRVAEVRGKVSGFRVQGGRSPA